AELACDAVGAGIGPGDTDGLGVEIKGVNRRVTQLGSGDGENSGASADVENRLWRARSATSHQFTQAIRSRRMLAGAEAEARVEHQDGLASPCPPPAPAWLNQQRLADFERLEMPLPGFRPVLARELSHGNPRRAGDQSAVSQTGEPVAQGVAFGAESSWAL